MKLLLFVLAGLVFLVFLNFLFVYLRLLGLGRHIRSMLSHGASDDDVHEYLGKQGYWEEFSRVKCLMQLRMIGKISATEYDELTWTCDLE
jgi:hypothetical protein